jgi:phosphoglycolate phosphatase-like HAD superfamily hydrolase
MPSGGGSIMHWIAKTCGGDPAEQARQVSIVEEEERRGLQRMQLNAGFGDLAGALAAMPGTRTAIATRNGPEALRAFHQLLVRAGHVAGSGALFHVQLARGHFSPALQRAVLNKPSHEPAHEIIRRWGLDVPLVEMHEGDLPVTPDVLFVGDNLDDCICGRRAGLSSIFLTNGEEDADGSYAMRVLQDGRFICHTARDLSQVADILLPRGRRAANVPGASKAAEDVGGSSAPARSCE